MFSEYFEGSFIQLSYFYDLNLYTCFLRTWQPKTC